MRKAKKPRVLVFGNPLVSIDSIPLQILPQLREKFPEIDFVEFDPSENLEDEGRHLLIIDSAEGIRKPSLITDIGLIHTPKIYSMHDYDLGYSLKLLKKLGYIDSVTVFGVPLRMRKAMALKQVSDMISATLPSRNGSRSSCRGHKRV